MSKTTGRPSLQSLKRHADVYGTDCVLDTAIDCGYPKGQLVDLLSALDKIDKRQYASRKIMRRIGLTGAAPKPRLGISERVDRAVASNTLVVNG
jgi:hypothetical protein